MNPWDDFGDIVCITYAPHVERRKAAERELKRVGILGADNFRFSVTSRGMVFDVLYRTAKLAGMGLPQTASQFSCTMGHIDAIRSAFLSGKDSVLILEDDIRFLKDADEARRIVGSWRESKADVVLLDKFLWGDLASRTPNGAAFLPFTKSVRGASCYALTRNGMRCALTAWDNLAEGRRIVPISDQIYDYLDCPRAYSVVNACVQVDYDGSMNSSIYRTLDADVYRAQGVDLSLYQER